MNLGTFCIQCQVPTWLGKFEDVKSELYIVIQRYCYFLSENVHRLSEGGPVDTLPFLTNKKQNVSVLCIANINQSETLSESIAHINHLRTDVLSIKIDQQGATTG